MKRCWGLAVLAVLALAGLAGAADWPGWRGPTGQGLCDEKNLPLTWGGPTGENVLWKVPLPGQEDKARQDNNQSSPIVCRGRVFVTASYWPAGVSEREFPEHHVACHRAADGKRLWDVKIAPGPWRLSDLRGGYTAPTPASDGERVFVLFGSAVLAAVDLDGKLLWRREIVPHEFDVALGTSPVLYKDTVLLQCDQVNSRSQLMAFDRKSGEPRWQRKRPDVGFSHSTPVLAKVAGRPELLVAASDAVQGVDPEDGTVRWWCEGNGDTASPVLADGLVYCDSGRGSPGVAVEPAGSGDVTATARRWRLPRVPEGFSSPVAADGLLYRVCNPGVLKCWRMKDGAEVYTRRLGDVETAASPVVTADGRIYVASAGRSYVVGVGPKGELLGGGDLGDRSQASPAIADGRLFLKGRQYLWCVGSRR
jgi:outer membrane protein assembly factor BamB